METDVDFEPPPVRAAMTRRAALAGLLAGLGAFSPARGQSSDAGDPVATVKSLQDGLLNVLLKASSLTPKQRFDALQPAIAAAFDLSGMAQSPHRAAPSRQFAD